MIGKHPVTLESRKASLQVGPKGRQGSVVSISSQAGGNQRDEPAVSRTHFYVNFCSSSHTLGLLNGIIHHNVN